MTHTLPETLFPESDWSEQAACRAHDSALFFPVSEEGEQVRAAKAVCAGCPVREECLAYAIETRQPYGIWGGQTPKERRRIRRRIQAA